MGWKIILFRHHFSELVWWDKQFVKVPEDDIFVLPSFEFGVDFDG